MKLLCCIVIVVFVHYQQRFQIKPKYDSNRFDEDRLHLYIPNLIHSQKLSLLTALNTLNIVALETD